MITVRFRLLFAVIAMSLVTTALAQQDQQAKPLERSLALARPRQRATLNPLHRFSVPQPGREKSEREFPKVPGWFRQKVRRPVLQSAQQE